MVQEAEWARLGDLGDEEGERRLTPAHEVDPSKAFHGGRAARHAPCWRWAPVTLLLITKHKTTGLA